MPDRGRDRGRNSRSRSPSKSGKKTKKEKKETREKKKHQRGPGTPATDSSDEVHSGASSLTSQALAIPTDNAVLTPEFVNSLATSINELTRSVKDLHVGMASLQKESKEQRAQVSAILGELHGMNAKIEANNNQYKSDMDTLNKEIEEKLAKLKAGAGPPRPPTAAAAVSAGSASSGGPAPSASPGGPPSGSYRPTRIWIKGFKETLTTKYLNDFARSAVDRLPAELRTGAKTGAPGFGPAVYIDYPLDTRIAPIKEALSNMNLKHKDEAGQEHLLRISSDLPLAVRHKGRVLGELWKLVEPHVADLPVDVRPQNYKLGNSNGKLFLVLEHRPLELFATSVDDQGTLHINPNLANLNRFQVTDAMAQSWAASATRSAARPGQ
jgi:hypothetical protein